MQAGSHAIRLGAWMTIGGLLILAVGAPLSLLESAIRPNGIPAAEGMLAGCALAGAGAALMVGAGDRPRAPRDRARGEVDRAEPLASVARRVLDSFEAWRAGLEPAERSLARLDGFVRETLLRKVGAERVRCLRYSHGGNVVQSIGASEVPADTESEPPRSALSGPIGAATATGRPQFAECGDPLRDADGWDCVWPIHDGSHRLGLIAVGRLPERFRRDRQPLSDALSAVALCWRLVQAESELARARRTDAATGVLCRQELFERGEAEIGRARLADEPVVVVMIVLEGVRALDDAGLWGRRDALVEQVGATLRSKLRPRDVIGRFSDDRFVIVISRMDEELGRMATGKLALAAEQVVASAPAPRLAVRAAFAGGSGTFADLVSSAARQVAAGRRAPRTSEERPS